MEPLLFAFYIILGLATVKIVILLGMAKGNPNAVVMAIRAFYKVLLHGDAEPTTIPTSNLPEKVAPCAPALWPLYLLQQEGRLVDFLLEDISSADDSQVGAGVREVHDKCRSYLLEKWKIQPVLDASEGDQVSIKEGFDPSRIMLSGHIEGNPPFQGELKHHGWVVSESNFPPIPESFLKNPILAQAEVEIPAK